MDDYNFGGLDGWIAEAIHSGVSADVIYKEVIASIRRQVKHHKTCYTGPVFASRAMKNNWKFR